jgi:hypothetical protein
MLATVKNMHLILDQTCECLDCMKKIKEGYCSIDIENFDIDMFYYFRSFWSKVDIKGEDECWPWKGSIRKDKYETVAYMIKSFS